MTERLKHLLDGEAHDLPVPPPAANAVIRHGRGLRRRNRIAAGACGAAAAVIIAGSVAALSGGSNQAAPDPAAPTVSDNAVFAYGDQVAYDGPGSWTRVQDIAVKSLYYTSAGVLVRHGENDWSDGGGPQRFSLVTPDGAVDRLGLVTEETVHATDPEQPYVVYGEAVDGELQVVVYDVTADAEAARVTVAPTKDSWFPVAIDGDTVYVQNGYDSSIFAVDWRSGTAERSDLSGVWEVAGGHAGVEVRGQPSVVDISTGDTLVSVDSDGYFDLSPDGRYAQLVIEDEEGPGGFEVYDVESGASVSFEGNPFDWGWTADGDLFTVEKATVRTCDAATGECHVETYNRPDVPNPGPVTSTMSDPVCPAGDRDCYNDEVFLKNCYDHPDECEWMETVSVDDRSPALKLGGRAYES
jgi:hypothetical protein